MYGVGQRSLTSRVAHSLRPGGRVAVEHGHTVVHALRNISLEITAGDRVALLGHNGAGKSTLIRLIAGIYEPQDGQVRVTGQVTALLNLALGMDRTATGYDNIILSGLMHGLDRSEIQAKVKEIARFSELEEFLDMPLRSYSQGMAMRLAFGIATSISPDILLLDEWIGAGDRNFLNKVQERMEKIIGESNILVLATHQLNLLRRFCNKAVLLEKGRMICFGEVEDVIQRYDHAKLS